MALPPIRHVDATDWVLTTAGIRTYPKAAHELIEFAESRGWWALDGLPVRVAPDGTHRIRVEVGRSPVMGRNGYRYMILWTSEPENAHAQFHVSKILAISTEWATESHRCSRPECVITQRNGWISVPGVSDVMTKIERFPLSTPPALQDTPGAGGDQYLGRA